MVKVSLLGANGGVGQPLSFLLKLSPYISKLALYDVTDSKGHKTDISHINTNVQVESYSDIKEALENAHLVIITAGIARKPGMSRDDLFKINGEILRKLCIDICQFCPNAIILIISNPINSMVPLFIECVKSQNLKFDFRKIMGITMLDIIRAETFLGDTLNEIKGGKFGNRQYDNSKMGELVTVVGGHSGKTIVPIVLDKSVIFRLGKKYDSFIKRVQFGGDEVVKAKNGKGSATFSMAFAGFKFIEEVLKSLHRNSSIDHGKYREYISAYVYLPVVKNGKKIQEELGNDQLEYFGVPIKLKNGYVEEVEYDFFEKLTSCERQMVATSVNELLDEIEKGKQFVKESRTVKL
ncbi:hypothetical protein KAFR_0F02690 [Kazachstania africana CBS 2517]|uniref:Malate dehydrogenase n=1 Tax=Kazachstania africana (strain ATCC 22294 / BCRC 22015 / CBS 2517 / CECT 1963 / NBRC 1671 / NRRL Y-8276) TaxID=1071382 RepID=H2AWW6_KAZAF|nr:hypothetical protein KAFR_0F02690 [Kazachstania africana CBS 2517]CCF58866.1 hypothetical protein KAFR_0F02690 [Kazachstania africana CBS 2517]